VVFVVGLGGGGFNTFGRWFFFGVCFFLLLLNSPPPPRAPYNIEAEGKKERKKERCVVDIV